MKNYHRVMLGKGSAHADYYYLGLRIRRALKVAPNIDFYRYEVSFTLKKA